MRTSQLIKYSLLGLGLLAIVSIARAATEAKTITGEAKCAKADMKVQSTCQTVVQVTEGKMVVNYYVTDNEVAKNFHHVVCGHPQKVTATGTVASKDGKLELTPTKLILAKN